MRLLRVTAQKRARFARAGEQCNAMPWLEAHKTIHSLAVAFAGRTLGAGLDVSFWASSTLMGRVGHGSRDTVSFLCEIVTLSCCSGGEAWGGR